MKRRRKLKKKPVMILLLSIFLIIVLTIFAVKTIKELNYRKTLEYKIMTIGYSKDEYNLLERKTNKEFMESLLTKEYDKMYINILKETYYIPSKVNQYINYYDNHLNSKANEIVSMVNVGADKKWYEDVKDTDTSKDLLMLNNKFNKLSKDYVPDDLVNVKNWYAYGNNPQLRQEAYDSFINMFNAAKEEDLTIIINSAYRPYSSQEKLYAQYVDKDGEEVADTYAARPGHSEHQTGLTIDVTTYGVQGEDFDKTDEFKWLQEHAHEYGFILRYPKDKENLTGYAYESWHYRYVGIEAATIIHNSNITFDEYYAYYIENA